MKRSNSSTSISSIRSGYGSSENSKWKSLGDTLRSFTRGTLPRMQSVDEHSLSGISSLRSSGTRSVTRALLTANAQSRQLFQKGKPAPSSSKLQAKTTTGGLISSSVEIEIEYWHQAAKTWTNEAFLKVNKNQGKVTINSEFEKVKLDLDSNLRVEHTNPISRDFNIILGCNGAKYRIAVLSEFDGNSLILALSKLGATVIPRRSLPPCVVKSGLRPISEGQVLTSSGSPSSPLPPNMHLETGRNPILRRKSTGSTSDHSYNRLNSPSTAVMASEDHSALEDEVLLPRSNSMCVKDPEAPVFFHSIGGTQTTNPEKLETFSRRLNHRLEDRKNAQSRSDQSLNSDEISHENSSYTSTSSCNTSVSSGTGSETEEGFDDFHTTEEIGHYTSDGLGSNPESLTGSLPRKAGVISGNNKRKMEKYEFLLVNIEGDRDILDPSHFGVAGEMVQCNFDDYPEDTFSLQDEVDYLSESPMPQWIRRSFEDLDLEFASTTHERKNSHKRGVQKSQAPTYFHMQSSTIDEQSTLSLSMGNLTTVIEAKLYESHSGTETPATTPTTTKSTSKNHESHYYGAKGAHQSAVRHEVINFLNDRPGIEV